MKWDLAVVKLHNLIFGSNWPKKYDLLLLHLYAHREHIVLIECQYRQGLYTYPFYRYHLLLIKCRYKLTPHTTLIKSEFSLCLIL